jgi:hypothetical protein
MKIILTKNGDKILVDDEDFETLSKYKWHIGDKDIRKNKYAKHCLWKKGNKTKSIYMHRMILHVRKGRCIDHINGNGLDNRKENLRICNRTENQHNRKIQSNNTSGFKGVCPWRGKYMASIRNNKKLHFLGYFIDPKEAAVAYNERAKELFGEFARLNPIP